MANIDNYSTKYSIGQTEPVSADKVLKHLAGLLGSSTAKQLVWEELSGKSVNPIDMIDVPRQSDTES